MNKNSFTLAAVVFTFTLISCSKNSNDPPPTETLPPLQLVKKITRYKVNGVAEVMGDSTAYTYDEKAG